MIHPDEESREQVAREAKATLKCWLLIFLSIIVLLALAAGRSLVEALEELLLACAAPAVVLMMLVVLSRAVPIEEDDGDESDEEIELLSKRRTQEDIKEQLISCLISQDLIGDCCDICQEDYLADDILAESKNPDCSHRFHMHCITQWLLKNEECPICRRRYLVAEENHQSGECETSEEDSDLEANAIVVTSTEESDAAATRRRR